MADDETRAAQEAAARQLGWSPQDKFRGPADQWLDAPEYIAKVNENYPILRERVRNLGTRYDESQRQNMQLVAQIGELTQTLADFRTFSDKREERAYKKARADIQAEMDAAVDRSDPQAYKQAKQRLETLDEEVTERAKDRLEESREPRRTNGREQPVVVPGEVQEWLADNAWFNQDPVLNTVAVATHALLKRNSPGMPLADNLALVREEVVVRYPEKFGLTHEQVVEQYPHRFGKKQVKDDNEEPPPRVAAPSGRQDERRQQRRQTKEKSYDDLPPEAKKTCDRFVKNKMVKSREEYVKEYFAQDEANTYEVVGE